MRKVIIASFVLAMVISIYTDLTEGTLQPVSVATAEMPTVSQHPHFKYTVRPGETLLSIVEERLGGELPIPVATLIGDFKKLNSGEVPERLQIGKTYLFPLYP